MKEGRNARTQRFDEQRDFFQQSTIVTPLFHYTILTEATQTPHCFGKGPLEIVVVKKDSRHVGHLREVRKGSRQLVVGDGKVPQLGLL